MASMTELEAYLREYDACAITPTRKLIAAYVKGQLGPLPRKSVMPIARAAGIAPRTLQELLSLHRWDEERMRSLVHARARRLMGEGGLAVLHVTSVPKRGLMTPGVDRQDRGGTGRPVNCCVVVQLSLAREGNWLVLGGELYLPRSWTNDPPRLREAGIPEGTAYRSEGGIGLALLDRALSSGFRPECVLFAHSVASEPGLLEGLAERRLRFATEVPESFRGSPPDNGTGSLVELALSRGRIEAQATRDLEAIGFDHFEVRAYRSLQRHLRLSEASLLFLAEQRAARLRSGAATSRIRRAEPV